jgi:cystathionine beta-lyase family protein involved in aluminum resistance
MKIETKTEIQELMRQCEAQIAPAFVRAEHIAKHNQEKVLRAFWAEKVGTIDLQGTTGYGIDDEGRDKLERIYARVFGTDAALVRPQIISGTHALSLGIFGVCRPGDHLVYATGTPYDTLQAVLGIRETVGSLAEWGITHSVVPLTEAGGLDMTEVLAAVTANTKLVMFQRSRGYANRRALDVGELQAGFATLRKAHPGIVIGVDNCYGEFVQEEEPTAVGADLAMGSLIKNPGAGIAPTGGYIVGKQHLIKRVAAQLTAPGVGAEMGPTHDFLRLFYQSLFLAPHTVLQAVKASILASSVFAALGFRTSPTWDTPRSDLIVATTFESPERLLAFCHAVQTSAPIDSYVRPVAGHMAGYEDEIIMAAGSFVQGGSLDMSADGPMRPPYTGYFQGSLTYEHAYLAITEIAEALQNLSSLC